MDSKHTPGPWRIGEKLSSAEMQSLLDGNGHFVEIDAPTHGALAFVVWRMEDDDTSPKQEASAHLIAAAPDLFAALVDCVMVMERELAGLRVIQPELRAARAAIAKAIGEAAQ